MSTLHDVAAWGASNGASRDAIYEVKKIPARLGMHDDDLGLIPACLRHFEHVVAPSGYGVVSKATDIDGARRRGNARVRSLLQQFLASVVPAGATSAGSARALWDPLIDYVADLEGFVDEGAPWTRGASRSLTLFRARAACGPAALDQAEVDRINRELDANRRKSLRKAIKRVNALVAVSDQHPAIAAMLPAAPLRQPSAADRARRIVWEMLPATFRASTETLFARATETPEDQAAEVRRRLAAGEDRATVLAEFEAMRTREMGNRAAAHANYRNAISWVLRGQLDRGLDLGTLADVRALLTVRAIEDALDDHVARSKSSMKLKDADKSQTGHNRITALRTLALYGLRDLVLAEDIKLLAAPRARVVRAPGKDGLEEDAKLFCAELLRAPHLAARFVNAPARLAALAEGLLVEARAAKSEARELSALRLYAAGALGHADVAPGSHRQPDPRPRLGCGGRPLPSDLDQGSPPRRDHVPDRRGEEQPGGQGGHLRGRRCDRLAVGEGAASALYGAARHHRERLPDPREGEAAAAQGRRQPPARMRRAVDARRDLG